MTPKAAVTPAKSSAARDQRKSPSRRKAGTSHIPKAPGGTGNGDKNRAVFLPLLGSSLTDNTREGGSSGENRTFARAKKRFSTPPRNSAETRNRRPARRHAVAMNPGWSMWAEKTMGEAVLREAFRDKWMFPSASRHNPRPGRWAANSAAQRATASSRKGAVAADIVRSAKASARAGEACRKRVRRFSG